MAREEEKRDLQEIIALEKELQSLRKGDVDISFLAIENLKEIFGIKSRTRDIDKAIVQNAKAINKQLLGQESSLANIREYTRATLKNEKLLLETRTLERAILREIGGEESDRAEAIRNAVNYAEVRDGFLREEKSLLAENLKLTQELSKLETEQKVDTEQYIKTSAALDKNIEAQAINNQLLQEQETLIDNIISGKEAEGIILEDTLQTEKERAAFFAIYNKNQLVANQELRKAALDALGPAQNFLNLLGAIPGLSGITNKVLDETISNLDEQIEKEGDIKDIKKETNKALQKGVGNILKQVTSAGALATTFSGFVLKALLDINKAQTEFVRETGTAIAAVDALNASLISAGDYIRTATNLSKEFGFNAALAFDNINIQQAAELVELTGLAAEEAASLALYSQTTGTSLDTNLDTIVAQVGQQNIANKTAVNYTQVLRDIGTISKATALTFQGNTVEIARAAQQARILGINLQQVDNIAAGLLDIESSIRSEFEAEVITGQQLNLERARFFALTNDLNGLTQELAANQEIINKFATGNRIEQEAIAGALNMSRDEMADMIFQQRLQLGITDEQARLTAGLSQQDFERLTIQESIAKSLTKIGDILAVFIEPVLAGIAELMPVIAIGLAGFGAIKLIGLITSLGRTLALLTSISAISNPAAFAVGLGATALGLGTLYGLTKSFGDRVAKVGDAIIPAGRGPIISTREGGLIQGTTNDDIIMAPGVARGGRNEGLSKTDIQAIANAVRDGASKANINLDGGRVSNRLQTALAVNTRAYSV